MEHVDVLSDIASLIEHLARGQQDRQHGGREVTALWEAGGIEWKARADKLIMPHGKTPCTVVDLKKCQEADYLSCQKAIDNYDYHVQAALYHEGIKAILGCLPHFVWVFVEEHYPHGIQVIDCDDHTLQAGLDRLLQFEDQYKACLDSGEWPGYGTKIIRGGLPSYRLRQLQQDQELAG